MEANALMNQRSGRMCVSVRRTGSGRTVMFLSVCIARKVVLTVVIDSVVYNITYYVWFKYDLGQKYHAPQVQPGQGMNS